MKNLMTRLVGWAFYGVKYKKVLVEIKQCPYRLAHPAHTHVKSGYTPGRMYYCEGIK